MGFNLPISRAAIAARPAPIRKRIQSMRRTFDREVEILLGIGDIVSIAEKARRQFPEIVRHPLGSDAVEAGGNIVYVNCTVARWSDAWPVISFLESAGFLLSDEPDDDAHSLTRTFWLARKKGFMEISLKLYSDKTLGAKCVPVIIGYQKNIGPIPIYKLVCDENEKEAAEIGW